MTIKTKRMICLLIGVASVLTIIGTVSYAYFSTVGEFQNQTSAISTGTARATFRDNDTGITGELSFGESLTKKFTIENTGTVETKVRMYFKDLINTYTEGSLTYTLSQAESVDGPYTEIVSKKNVPKNEANPESAITTSLSGEINIPVGITYHYNLVVTLNYLPDVNQDADINAKFSTNFDLRDVNDVNMLEEIIAVSQGTRTNFDEPAATDEGVFEMEDDYGISYYYRGAAENNYVKYGVNKAGQEMWWRIIRINGDRSVRMVYDGTQGYANGTSNNDRFLKVGQPFNSTYADNKYIGWMYGPAGTTASTNKEEAQSNLADSDAKKVVDAWYKENIVDTGYGANVSDAIFCNDRSIPGKAITNWGSDTELGYGQNLTAYGATARTGIWNSNKIQSIPTFKCLQKNDAFTVSDIDKGNGALTYPVGLITADEIEAAGSGKYGATGEKTNYYLYKSDKYYQWALSAHNYYSGHAYVFLVNKDGSISRTPVNNTTGAIAPVINLTPEYANTMIGTGTITNPYRARK